MLNYVNEIKNNADIMASLAWYEVSLDDIGICMEDNEERTEIRMAKIPYNVIFGRDGTLIMTCDGLVNSDIAREKRLLSNKQILQ